VQLVRRGVLAFIGLAGACALVGGPASGSPPARAAVATQVTLNLWPAGNGRIEGSAGGTPIDPCDFGGQATCERLVDLGSTVTLTAIPEPTQSAPSQFSHWSRSECPDAGSCTFTVDQDGESAVAVFSPLGLEVGINGDGTVTASAGALPCQPGENTDWDAKTVCSGVFDAEQEVTLTAVPATPGDSITWGPGCEPAGGNPSSATCVVTMTNIRTFAVVAFGANAVPGFPFKIGVNLRVKHGGSGKGKVSGTGKDVNDSSWSVDCGSTCTINVGYQSPITLKADAAAGSKFVRWNGVCATKVTCRFYAGSATSVTAVFDDATPPPPPPPPPSPPPPPPPPRQAQAVVQASLLGPSLQGTGANRALAFVVVVNRAGLANVRLRKRAKPVAKLDRRLKLGRNTIRLRLKKAVKPGWYVLTVKIVSQGAKGKTLSRRVRIRR
jgi:List-Bact-rpt repeat protein